ncbi:hypothetical protein KFE25_009321 [Diacronema lutheri]|nr:hypothetical protein KFE25_009321 [Diacronema lutheri]
MACPPTGRAAGESCGGPCDRDGLCAPGLTCAPVDTLKTRVLEFFAPDARSGVCTTREPLAPACVGCPSPAPPDDEGIIDAARWAVATVNAGRNNAHALELVRIASASKQVVAGIKYMLTIEVGESSCANDGRQHEVGACPLLADTQTLLLDVEVVDAPWRTPRYMLLSKALRNAHR